MSPGAILMRFIEFAAAHEGDIVSAARAFWPTLPELGPPPPSLAGFRVVDADIDAQLAARRRAATEPDR